MNPEQPQSRPSSAVSPWSIQICKVAGIPVRLHFTFILFLVWVGIVGGRQGSIAVPILIVTLFFCVILHEFGHALTALHFGIKTRDITLYPIGGVAMLDDRPSPKHELWIAIAGPLVNLCIAGCLFLATALINPSHADLWSLHSSRSFSGSIFMANLVLAVFNLLPAFPMDGGRVLRAALALRMPEEKATQIAATIGQALAIVIGFVGLFIGTYPLMLVAFFVFIAAGQEASATMTRSFLTGHTVRDAMQTRFRTITHGATLEEAGEYLLAGSQHDFPVVAGDSTIGILTRAGIARGIASGGSGLYVSDAMNREFKRAAPDRLLEDAMELFANGDQTPVLVMEQDQLVGLLTSENLSEFIMLEAAKSKSSRA